ncbi:MULTISPECIES: MATE family efflux transporter [unclassified Rhizobium]|uniref:MATE family efflux transporter n=1 Tax=unclassified Rhizobium TaxID=2613769 RepID=UPI0007148F96|nr:MULTISPECIES: MATE family efflux transporter [unclassified Rhizobium]KQS95094.1 MATE family efflux transporter [Rhizobium sp. Leaf386]KQS95628.1 MATE family efflux transporter [Rhizobium sp. Leaf391]KQU01855.1 MATE family efflux transporter [Rhizobium sp. Leaf453]
MPQAASSQNAYLTAPLGAIFIRTALPIIFVMSMNGLLTVVDAVFLGIFVGPDAVGAVTIVFPVFMLLVAFATLVASGMASVLARHLGAGRFAEAQQTFMAAQGLALAISLAAIVLFAGFGESLVRLVANGDPHLAQLAHVYLSIMVYSCPVQFLLSVNADALRCEGKAGLMAALSLVVSLANMALNYLLIAGLGWGVAGSAGGTALAQVLALGVLVVFRVSGRTPLRLRLSGGANLFAQWGRMLALGAPQSLGFIGLALVSATVIGSLQMVAGARYDTVVSAYGIITRIMTFAYLPLLGMSQAMQAIVGNSAGAGDWGRARGGLRLAIIVALVYCLCVEAVLIGLAAPIGLVFVDDAGVVGEVARIIPVIMALYLLSGPLMMVGSYFQAIGDAGKAAILGLTKPYLFTMPLVLVLSRIFGERGIWFATPVAEVSLLCVTGLVLWTARGQAASRPGASAAEPI